MTKRSLPFAAECRGGANEAAKLMPGPWRVHYRDKRYEFRMTMVPGEHFFDVRYRTVKPVGWVCFEVKADPRRTPGSTESWAIRKKVLPESFDTPVAAAAALILAGLVEVERAYIRGNR